MKNNILYLAPLALAGLAVSIPLNAATTVNFNAVRNTPAATTVTNPGYGLWSQGTETWNVLDSSTGSNLVDSTGAATTVGFNVSFSSRNQNGGWGPDSLTDQGFYSSNDDITTHTLTISGLTAATPHDLLFYFADAFETENITANGSAPVDFTGSTTTTGGATYTDAFNDLSAGHFWYFADVNSDASGDIAFTFDGSGYETLTGFQVSAVPESSSFALIAGVLGLTSIMLRRRR